MFNVSYNSALAVLWCMRSQMKDSWTIAKQRILGTFIGGVYGL